MLLESALRELDTERLNIMVKDISNKASDVFDPCKEKLVVAELTRRRAVAPAS
jgi:hypothetical protein